MDITLFLLMFAVVMIIPILELLWGLTFCRGKFVWSKWFGRLIECVVFCIVLTAIICLDIPYIKDNGWAFFVIAVVVSILIRLLIKNIFNKNE